MKIIEWKEIFSCFKNNQVFSYFADSKSSAISVGSFDGIHLGHRKLMASLIENSKDKNYLAGVFTFTRPLPSYKHSSDYCGDISTLNQRLKLFEELGIDFVILCEFDSDFASLKGIEFFDILKKVCNLKFIVEGVDFRCGYKGATDAQGLKYWAEQNDVGFCFIEPVFYKESNHSEERISSSYIRKMIQLGFFTTVQDLLLHSYELDFSRVEKIKHNSSILVDKSNVRQVLPPEGFYHVSSEGNTYRLKVGDKTIEIENADDTISSVLF